MVVFVACIRVKILRAKRKYKLSFIFSANGN